MRMKNLQPRRTGGGGGHGFSPLATSLCAWAKGPGRQSDAPSTGSEHPTAATDSLKPPHTPPSRPFQACREQRVLASATAGRWRLFLLSTGSSTRAPRGRQCVQGTQNQTSNALLLNTRCCVFARTAWKRKENNYWTHKTATVYCRTLLGSVQAPSMT